MLESGNKFFTIETPKYSEWRCYLFGSRDGYGMIYTPREGDEPNWFWREMQFLAFGHRWVKVKK